MRNLIVLCCIALGIVACHSSRNMAKLNDVKWVLQTLNDKDIVLSDPNSEISIQFNDVDKRVNGRAGCNRYFGNYEMEHDKLKFSPMGATRMTCPDIQTEAEFFRMLEEVDGCAIKYHVLSFLIKRKVVATFQKSVDNEKITNK